MATADHALSNHVKTNPGIFRRANPKILSAAAAPKVVPPVAAGAAQTQPRVVLPKTALAVPPKAVTVLPKAADGAVFRVSGKVVPWQD